MADHLKQFIPTKDITVSSKFVSDKFSYDIKIRDLCNQVALLLYNGKYTYGTSGILGTKQQVKVLKNGLKDFKFVIHIPEVVSISKDSGATCSGTSCVSYSRDSDRMLTDLNAMVRHAQSAGVQISIKK